MPRLKYTVAVYENALDDQPSEVLGFKSREALEWWLIENKDATCVEILEVHR
jgi:hypothetical protein